MTETSSNLHYQKLTILALIFLKFAGLKEEHQQQPLYGLFVTAVMHVIGRINLQLLLQ